MRFCTVIEQQEDMDTCGLLMWCDTFVIPTSWVGWVGVRTAELSTRQGQALCVCSINHTNLHLCSITGGTKCHTLRWGRQSVHAPPQPQGSRRPQGSYQPHLTKRALQANNLIFREPHNYNYALWFSDHDGIIQYVYSRTSQDVPCCSEILQGWDFSRCTVNSRRAQGVPYCPRWDTSGLGTSAIVYRRTC